MYQQLVGCLAYIAVWGRPDVARAHVILACHLINPGQDHANHAIKVWRYLLGTRTLALQASGNGDLDAVNHLSTTTPLFFGASDASYADEPTTRKSSQGYLFQLGGLTVDWKSSVQRTVTKSTTESELLALSLAGSQLQEWTRFLQAVSLILDTPPSIYCDNQQTVGIVTKAIDRLHTKVKHVDIHQLWIRQEVLAGRISVQWKPTTEMPADGLTKALGRQRFEGFIRQLNLVDIAHLIHDDKDPSINYPKVDYPHHV